MSYHEVNIYPQSITTLFTKGITNLKKKGAHV
jgi:hypothetical protein